MAERRVFTAEKAEKLDKFIMARLGVNFGEVRSLLRRGDVRVNGKRMKDGSVAPGDEVSVFYVRKKTIPIVYMDDALIAADKPRGVSVTPDGRPAPTLTEILTEQLGRAVYPCHRIDNNTAGLVLFAFDEAICMQIAARFAAGDVHKEYRAIVCGEFPGMLGHSAYLQKDAKAALVRVTERPLPGSRPISAWFSPIKYDSGLTLLAIRPRTGRTHQLRAQLAHIGYPILGDDKYGDRAANKMHGVTRQRLWSIKIELPDDMPFPVRRFSIPFDDNKVL